MTARIISLILLLLFALPLSALALGTTDNPKAELQALITAAEKEVVATSAWLNADKTQRQRLSEEAVRYKIITTVQSGFDKMQMEVDRKIDELLEMSLSEIAESRIAPAHKQRIRELFKEELYKYMYRKEDTKIEGTYQAGRERSGSLNLLFTEGLKNNRVFEYELLEIIKNINKQMTNVLSEMAVSDLRSTLYSNFNNL